MSFSEHIFPESDKTIFHFQFLFFIVKEEHKCCEGVLPVSRKLGLVQNGRGATQLLKPSLGNYFWIAFLWEIKFVVVLYSMGHYPRQGISMVNFPTGLEWCNPYETWFHDKPIIMAWKSFQDHFPTLPCFLHWCILVCVFCLYQNLLFSSIQDKPFKHIGHPYVVCFMCSLCISLQETAKILTVSS